MIFLNFVDLVLSYLPPIVGLFSLELLFIFLWVIGGFVSKCVLSSASRFVLRKR